MKKIPKTDLRRLSEPSSIPTDKLQQLSKMPYYESELDYDSASAMKEQRDYNRYYNVPVEIDGILFSSLADYDEYLRLKEKEHVRLQKMTIDLKSLIQEMVNEEKIEKMYANMDANFPALGK